MPVPLRVLFFGTSPFAVPALQAIAAEHEIVAVVTQPDRPAGRGHKLVPTAVRTAADLLGLPVLTPERLKPELRAFTALAPDIAVVASYGRILPAALLELLRLGALNIHPSRLPLYRGANPISAPLADGRLETALSIMQMDAGLDTGPIVLQDLTTIDPGEIGTMLHDRLALAGAAGILVALAGAAAGTLIPRPQAGLASEAEITATFTRPLRGDDLLLDWQWTAQRVANMVRAYADRPAVRAELFGERIKVLRCELRAGRAGAQPGTYLGEEGDGVLVACGVDAVLVTSLIPPGRALQRGIEFSRRTRMESP